MQRRILFSIWQRDRKHLAIIDTLETFLSLRMAFILLRTDTEYDKVRNVRNSADDSRRIGKRYPKYIQVGLYNEVKSNFWPTLFSRW